MRIGLVIYGSLDTLSGGYLYDRKLVEHLRQAGSPVEVVTLPWRGYRAHLADNFSQRLYRRLRSLRVDILLQDELNHPSLVLVNRRLRLARQRPYPIVGIVHHLRSSERHAAWALPFLRAVERSYLRTLDGFVFNSRTTRRAVEDLRGRARWLAPLSGVVAYPAADHLALAAAAAAQGRISDRQRGARWHAGPLRTLFVGNLIPRKGLHHLIEALSRLPAEEWRLRVVGDQTVDPAYTASVRRQLEELGLQANVRLLGRVSSRELAEQYAAAHLLAGPSSYEGFGIVYLEAMAFGLPVLAGVGGAAGEVIRPGTDGFLVDPEDGAGMAAQLAALAGDRRRLAILGRNARRRFASRPRWADSAEAVRRYLEELI